MSYRDMCNATKERMLQKHDAGFISERFPDVSSIVVDMKHHRNGISPILLSRTLNFSSDSYAYFHVECLNRDCKDCTEGFHLDQVVSAMIRSHTSSREGQLDCEGTGITSGHVNISYKVTVQYNENLSYQGGIA
jgi:hypothetical protein